MSGVQFELVLDWLNSTKTNLFPPNSLIKTCNITWELAWFMIKGQWRFEVQQTVALHNGKRWYMIKCRIKTHRLILQRNTRVEDDAWRFRLADMCRHNTQWRELYGRFSASYVENGSNQEEKHNKSSFNYGCRIRKPLPSCQRDEKRKKGEGRSYTAKTGRGRGVVSIRVSCLIVRS